MNQASSSSVGVNQMLVLYAGCRMTTLVLNGSGESPMNIRKALGM